MKKNLVKERAAPDQPINLQAIFNQFAERVRENARQSARLGARLGRLQAMVASRRRQLEEPRRAADLAPMLALSVEAYNLVSRHAFACMDDLLTLGESALGTTVDAAPQVDATAPDAALSPVADQPRIALNGRPGQTIEADFVIQNDFDFPVSFSLRRLSLAEDESTRAKFLLSFTPDSAQLAPASHSVVRLRAELAEDLVPDTYIAQVIIDGMAHSHEQAQSKCFCIELQVAA